MRDSRITRVPGPEPDSADPRRLLLVEDDLLVAKAEQRVLEAAGWKVTAAATAADAAQMAMQTHFAVIVSDISLPDGLGTDLMRTIRTYDPEVPVVLVTGQPSLETAIDAVDLGAVQYLQKPVSRDTLLRSVDRAWNLRQLGRAKKEALGLEKHTSGVHLAGDVDLGLAFESALSGMYMAFQPIIELRRKRVMGYEALLRSSDATLATPPEVLAAAEQLGRTRDLGRRVRAMVAEAMPHMPAPDQLMFVNLHVDDLVDPMLFAERAPLSARAERVVLEITERTTLEKVTDVRVRINDLRRLGFQLAVDDLGAGYAGLTSFAVLEPEVVKLDMSLVRDVHTQPVKQRLIESIVGLCRSLSMRIVAEGIETPEELAMIRRLGCDFGQGYVFARPTPGFEQPAL